MSGSFVIFAHTATRGGGTMTTLRTLRCPACSWSIDVSPRIITVRCDECGAVFGNSKEELKERRDWLNARISEYHGAMMAMMQERDLVELALIPYIKKAPVLWTYKDVDLHCHNCGKVTRWIYEGGAARCADSACFGIEKPVARSARPSRKLSDDILDLLALMQSDDPLPDDTEYIKARPQPRVAP